MIDILVSGDRKECRSDDRKDWDASVLSANCERPEGRTKVAKGVKPREGSQGRGAKGAKGTKGGGYTDSVKQISPHGRYAFDFSPSFVFRVGIAWPGLAELGDRLDTRDMHWE